MAQMGRNSRGLEQISFTFKIHHIPNGPTDGGANSLEETSATQGVAYFGMFMSLRTKDDKSAKKHPSDVV